MALKLNFKRKYWTPATVLAVSLLVSGNALAEKNIEFTSDPSQDDFEAVMMPIINPMRQTLAMQPTNAGGHVEYSATYTQVALPEDADTISKAYFDGGGIGSNYGLTRFNVFITRPQEKSATAKGTGGVALTVGSLPYSRQQLLGASVVLGSDVIGARVGYSTLYGSNEFAACAANAEGIIRVFRLEQLVTVYAGGGISKAGAAAWWLPMSEKKKKVWFDRYLVVGADFPVGSIITGTSYSPISIGGESQFSTSPKQATMTFRAAVAW